MPVRCLSTRSISSIFREMFALTLSSGDPTSQTLLAGQWVRDAMAWARVAEL